MSIVSKVSASTAEPIKVTKAADKHIVSCLSDNPEYTGIRLSVKKTGCSGYSYVVDYVRKPEGDDIVIEQNGYVICIAKNSYPFLKGIGLDYIKQGLNSKFVFTNPNQTGECGCGESFTIE